jgi:hypothetical protein
MNHPPLPDGLAARVHRALEPLHALVYFAPETEQRLTDVGLRPGRMCYFAGRSAAMGAVGPGVVAATFYNFNPALVARHLPRAWTLADPPRVLAARLAAADAALRRLLAETVDTDEVEEAAALAREATLGGRVEGRALYAAHAGLEWPQSPHLVLWHAATLLREHRGDGHVAALTRAGLSGLEALVTHTATGRGFTEKMARSSRGWSDEEWSDAAGRLRRQGLLDAQGSLTEAGHALREQVESDTDRMATEPWDRLGESRTRRLVDLARSLSRVVTGNGAFPEGVFARR